MTIAQRLQNDGRKEGLKQGKKQGMKEVALKMYKEGVDPAFIKKYTGLSEEQCLEDLAA